MGASKKNNLKGLGDVVAKVTTAIGIEPCEGCNQRKEKLNQLFPFGVEELTQEENKYLGTFFETDKMELSPKEQKEILDIYFRIYKVKPFEPCTNCPGVWKSIINKLKKVYEN